MSRSKKPSKVVTMEAESGGGVTVADEKPRAAPVPPAPVRPAGPRNPSFWQKVAAIQKPDWGTRAFIYVYCLEPICNLKMGGETKYLVRLQEPIADEQNLMIDYGSGKYRLQLVNRKPAADKTDAIDTIELEIYNPKYPPKIPRSVWMNDPRNERWLALLPKEEPVAPVTGIAQVTETFKAFSDIQDRMEQKMRPTEEKNGNTDVDRMTSLIGAVKMLMPAAAPATDNTMLNTVVTLLTAQIQASQEEAKQLRAQVFQMITAQKEEHKGNQDQGLEALIDKLDKIAPKLSNLLGLGGEKLTDVVHGRRRPFLEELGLATLPPLAQNLAPILPMLAQRFLAGPAPSNGITPPAPNGTQTALPPGQSQAPAAGSIQEVQVRVAQYLNVNLMPMRKAFEGFLKADWRDEDHHEDGHVDGSDFADWIFENHGDTILKDARMLGSGNILAMFKGSPVLWPQLAPHEAKLAEFLDQCLRYEPPPPEAEENAVVVAEEK